MKSPELYCNDDCVPADALDYYSLAADLARLSERSVGEAYFLTDHRTYRIVAEQSMVAGYGDEPVHAVLSASFSWLDDIEQLQVTYTEKIPPHTADSVPSELTKTLQLFLQSGHLVLANQTLNVRPHIQTYHSPFNRMAAKGNKIGQELFSNSAVTKGDCDEMSRFIRALTKPQ